MKEKIKIGEYYIKKIKIKMVRDLDTGVICLKKEIILTTEEDKAKKYIQEEIEPFIKSIKRK